MINMILSFVFSEIFRIFVCCKFMISKELIMNYVIGQSREQSTLFPMSIDDYVAEDNIVRFIDAFVNELDMEELGFKHAKLKSTGRPPYMPSDLMKLYIYSYLNKIRTSRKIEAMWLMKKLTPDHKTISDFRKNNKKALVKVKKLFILMCKDMGLISSELFGIDGSKFAAVNSNNRNYSKRKLEKLQAKVSEDITGYLEMLDSNDNQEPNIIETSKIAFEEKLKALQEKQAKYQKLLEQIEASGDTQISLTDPDSRMMKNQQNQDMSYNVQLGIDSLNKLIVADDVVNEGNDTHQLHSMSEQIKENLEEDSITVVADKGYFTRDELKKCEENNITAYVPEIKKGHNKKKGMFTDRDFTYNKENDTYRCPGGNIMELRGFQIKDNKELKTYKTSQCKECKLKEKCTTSKTGRNIYRWVNEEIIDRVRERVSEHPEITDKRKELAEHPFGTMKRALDFGYFLTKGLESVRAEFSLSVLVYNMKRVLNILGFKKAMEMVMSLPKKMFKHEQKSTSKHIFFTKNSIILCFFS